MDDSVPNIKLESVAQFPEKSAILELRIERSAAARSRFLCLWAGVRKSGAESCEK